MLPIERARALLETPTPLRTDCGRICGGACCQGSQEEGMLLFPGEDALYAPDGRYTLRPLSKELGGAPLTLLICDGSCAREERPLACRLFPLLARFDAQGNLSMRIDPRARAVCPLCASGVAGLSREFADAARQACEILMEDASCAAFLRALDNQFRL
jgi:hypothetical protein